MSGVLHTSELAHKESVCILTALLYISITVFNKTWQSLQFNQVKGELLAVLGNMNLIYLNVTNSESAKAKQIHLSQYGCGNSDIVTGLEAAPETLASLVNTLLCSKALL